MLGLLDSTSRKLACMEGGQSDSDGQFGGAGPKFLGGEGIQKKNPDGGSDVLCPRQGPLKGELRVWVSLPD